ncbi:MAG: GNAT family N-acetyltransferase, partial [Gammaproteobacteria bacterium]
HRNLPAWISINYARAMMQRGKDAEHYLQGAISTGRIKEYRRQERRLAQKGALVYKSLTENEDLNSWLQEFLRIEGSGWKGRNSSALCSSDNYRLFFQKIVRSAYEKNRLQMLAVSIDGQFIAQKCNFISGPAAFSFKIGFDERFRRYSPGVLLEIENIRRFHEDRRLEWMDSCAEPGHPMIDSIWTERRTMQSLFVGLGKRSSHFIVAIAPFLRWLKHRII